MPTHFIDGYVVSYINYAIRLYSSKPIAIKFTLRTYYTLDCIKRMLFYYIN